MINTRKMIPQHALMEMHFDEGNYKLSNYDKVQTEKYWGKLLDLRYDLHRLAKE